MRHAWRGPLADVHLTLRVEAASFVTVESEQNIFPQVVKSPAVQALLTGVEQGGALSLAGADVAAWPFVAALLRITFPTRTILVVTAGVKAQESFHQDLTTWLARSTDKAGSKRRKRAESTVESEQSALFFPAWDILPHESKLPHVDVISERLETLVALTAGEPGGKARIVVSNVIALMQKTFPSGAIAERTRTLDRGQQIVPLDLVEWLEDQGYEPEAQVNHKGEIALRGGILDIFAPTSPWPVRVEFFGDEIESIREFDPISQLSKDPVDSVTIPPAGELGLLKRSLATDAKTPNASSPNAPLATLLNYLGRDALVVLCGPETLEQTAEGYAVQVPQNDPFYAPWDELQNEMAERRLACVDFLEMEESLSNEAEEPASAANAANLAVHFQSLEAFRPIVESAPDVQVAEAQRREFFAQLHRWLRQGFSVHVFCNTRRRTTAVSGNLARTGLRRRIARSQRAHHSPRHAFARIHLRGCEAGRRDRRGDFRALQGATSAPAEIAARRDVAFGARHRFHRVRGRRLRRACATRHWALSRVADFRSRCRAQADANGRSARAGQECLVIEYASERSGTACAETLRAGQRGASRQQIRRHRQGASRLATRWVARAGPRPRRRRNTPCAIWRRKCCASRRRANRRPGHAFPPDNTWQREFEGSFVYEETPDQMRAIVEAKTDMELPKPMDRLICGDVGYGKTEVAIRAAFKAVMGGKQVAILVPTTVLAQQHFNTFRERMADYPMRVELLSRFRTRARTETGDRATGGRRGGHRHRHASARAERHRVQGSRPGGHRRRAALRRDAQGEVQDAASTGGCADAQRHADSAHAVSRADRRARHEHHRNAAAGSAAGGNDRDAIRRAHDSRCHPARVESPGAGVLSAQSRLRHRVRGA